MTCGGTMRSASSASLSSVSAIVAPCPQPVTAPRTSQGSRVTVGPASSRRRTARPSERASYSSCLTARLTRFEPGPEPNCAASSPAASAPTSLLSLAETAEIATAVSSRGDCETLAVDRHANVALQPLDPCEVTSDGLSSSMLLELVARTREAQAAEHARLDQERRAAGEKTRRAELERKAMAARYKVDFLPHQPRRTHSPPPPTGPTCPACGKKLADILVQRGYHYTCEPRGWRDPRLGP